MHRAQTTTVDTVVTDPAWLARRDQATAALHHVPLASPDTPHRDADHQERFP